jgi:diadenosine tetraphosphate (Ap4A) HIT family hydrolase
MPKKHNTKRWIIAGVILAAVVAFFFGTNIALYVNYLLGNDILLELSVDKPILNIVRDQSQQVKFLAKSQTNPFCKADCDSTFKNIATGEIIEKANFTLNPGKQYIKEYTIKVTALGTGQELYSFAMECRSVQSALCHTSEEPSRRTILVSVNYNLTESEKDLRDQLKVKLEGLSQDTRTLIGWQNSLEQAAEPLNTVATIDGLMVTLGNTNASAASLLNELLKLQRIWQQQDYQKLSDETKAALKDYQILATQLYEANKSLAAEVSDYDTLVNEYNSTLKKFELLHNLFANSPIPSNDANKLIKNFNNAGLVMKRRTSLPEKQYALAGLADRASSLYYSATKEIRNLTLSREIGLYVDYDILCSVDKSVCHSHKSVAEISNQSSFELSKVCSEIETFSKELKSFLVNSSFNASTQLNIMRGQIRNNYSDHVIAGSTNADLLKEILAGTQTVNNTLVNITAIGTDLISALRREQQEMCMNTTVTQLRAAKPATVQIPGVLAPNVSIIFDEPKPKCCISNQCAPCCQNASCSSQASHYPVVFVHGHSFNKAISFEYSLDAFNQIEERLENDGYIDVGSLSTYVTENVPQGTFGMINAPIAIKASYYFDIYKQPENYVLVQTKSQNIDSYTVRLKSVIDSIKYVTGRPKVIIVAHSMGGLVTRRYLQVFGASDIDKVILIATPNKGIVGKIADYCPIVGSQLECEDMNSNSLFINKLNQVGTSPVPIYNIVGTGCKMQDGIGDGVVLEQNAELKQAQNYVVNGTCSGINVLHTELLDLDKYPAVYDIIREALRS